MSNIRVCKWFHDNKYYRDKFPELSEVTISIINNFLKHKTPYYREQTFYNYLLFLPRTLSQLKVTSIAEITSDDIIKWMNLYLKDKSQCTKSNYLRQLCVFFDYCQKHGFIAKSPILRRFRVKNPLSISRNLDKIEYSKVKRISETLPLQARTIIEFLDSTAARCGELVNIKVSDLDLVNCKVPVIGKGGIPGVLHFSKECSHLLEKLIEKRESPNNYVFLTSKGNKTDGKAIWQITSDLGKRTGIKGSLHPHRFRHTRATLEVLKGVPLESVSKKLRHKTKTTTLIYVHLVPEDAQFYYERAMQLHEHSSRIK